MRNKVFRNFSRLYSLLHTTFSKMNINSFCYIIVLIVANNDWHKILYNITKFKGFKFTNTKIHLSLGSLQSPLESQVFQFLLMESQRLSQRLSIQCSATMNFIL
jgi:hypothetical protein